MALGPLATVDLMKSIDVSVNVSGGGGTGQTEQFVMVCQELLKNERRLEITPQESWTSSKRSEKIERKKTGQPGQGKGSNSPKDKPNPKSFTKPLGTPTEGFVFLNFK